jgi:hypothetical protein
MTALERTRFEQPIQHDLVIVAQHAHAEVGRGFWRALLAGVTDQKEVPQHSVTPGMLYADMHEQMPRLIDRCEPLERRHTLDWLRTLPHRSGRRRAERIEAYVQLDGKLMGCVEARQVLRARPAAGNVSASPEGRRKLGGVGRLDEEIQVMEIDGRSS